MIHTWTPVTNHILDIAFSFPRSVIENCDEQRGSKQQEFILSLFWKLHDWNQGVRGVAVPPKALQMAYCLCLLLRGASDPRHSLACGSTTLASTSLFTWLFSLCVRLHPYCLLIRILATELGPTHSYDFIVTWLSLPSPCFQIRHIYSFQVDANC
jgi:hypothetical protein